MRTPVECADLEEASQATAEGTGHLSPEDIQMLEDLIIDSDIDDI